MGFIKLCGMVKPADIEAAQNAGADAVGLVIDYPPSPRSVDLETAANLAHDSDLPVVALLVDPDDSKLRSVIQAVHPWAIQLSGNESIEDIRALRGAASEVELWKVLHVPPEVSAASFHVNTLGEPVNDKEAFESDGGLAAGGLLESEVGIGYDIDSLLIRAQEYHAAGIDRILLDARDAERPGGTGLRLDWSSLVYLIGRLRLPVVLAGGLTPDNVAQAIELSGTAAVDVSSGIESAPGVKDPDLMYRFVDSARAAFEG